MRRNIDLTNGLIFSQRVLLALIQKGLSREKAYHLVQQHALKAWKEGKSLPDLLRSDGEIGSYLSSPELAKLFDVEFYLRYVDEIFARCSS
jgi:adenylosuccinate lyase